MIEELIEKLNISENITVLDMFCGAGGMSKGLSDSGLEVIAGIDINSKAIESYSSNMKHLSLCKDLTTFSAEEFDKSINKKLDVITASSPCQSFSLSGKRNPSDSRHNLFMEFYKYITYFKPKIIMMENVIGLLSMKNDNKEKIIDLIMNKLQENYNCCINKLYASDFEVPQNRRRVIIIGVRKDLHHIPEEIKPFNCFENRIPVKTILEPKENIDKKQFLSEKALLGIKNKKERNLSKGNGFGAQYIDLEKPCYTIPARYYKDGYDALVKYSDKEIRRLTVLELKRIQTFPDNYILKGSKKDQIIQIGNAVPCRFAYHLGLYIQNIFKKYL